MSRTKKKSSVWLWIALAILLIILARDKLSTEPLIGGSSQSGGSNNTTMTQAEKDRILAAVPETLRDNYYLQEKECGCCKSLSGKLAVTVVLVSDSVSVWDEASVNILKEELDLYAQDIVQEAAAYHMDVSFSFSFHHTSLTGDIASGDYSDEWQEPALSGAGLPKLAKLHNHITDLYDAKEAPLVFAFNKNGRSYASIRTNEYMVLFADKSEDTFQHELSHLFGANDFYYPSNVMNLAKTYLADSVMNSGALADPLTAYLIGWTDVLSDDAKTFLEQTNTVTAEYISAEHEKESFTGNGTKTYSNGVYTGDMVRGVRHGTGTMNYSDGGWYTGGWSNGNRSGLGYGKSVLDGGDVYEGEFLNGKRHGQGTYYFSDGSVYSGSWENGQRHGQGTYTGANGNSYTGNWVNGKRHGQGTYTYADGGYYTGSWENGEKSGTGTGKEYYDNGHYEGQFYNGKRHGQGTYTWDNGDSYSGQWADGKRTGYGTYTWSDGSSQTGNWQEGKFVG